jgi:hypothetical protein
MLEHILMLRVPLPGTQPLKRLLPLLKEGAWRFSYGMKSILWECVFDTERTDQTSRECYTKTLPRETRLA